MPKKVEQYDAERKQVLDRMFEILGISESNKTICLNDIDKDEVKLKAIEDLDVDIKRYFLTSGWGCYMRPNLKRKYYSVLKYLLRENNINHKQYTKTIKKKVSEGQLLIKQTIVTIEI
jgi:hypothetical protein